MGSLLAHQAEATSCSMQWGATPPSLPQAHPTGLSCKAARDRSTTSAQMPAKLVPGRLSLTRSSEIHCRMWTCYSQSCFRCCPCYAIRSGTPNQQ